MAHDARPAIGEGAGGYLLSAVVFAAVTALWVVIVQDDPFYRFIDVGGFSAPVMTLACVFVAPLFGFVFGRWRYELRHEGGALSFALKLIARAVHFTYAHALILLFTVAMAMDRFAGFAVDAQLMSLNGGAFDAAARFAPWLCAYLAGFNLGRAQRSWRSRLAIPRPATTDGSFAEFDDAPKRKGGRGRRERAEPVLDDSAFQPNEADARGDLGLPPTAAAPQTPPPAEEPPGFLPPQDFSKLRPGLNQLR